MPARLEDQETAEFFQLGLACFEAIDKLNETSLKREIIEAIKLQRSIKFPSDIDKNQLPDNVTQFIEEYNNLVGKDDFLDRYSTDFPSWAAKACIALIDLHTVSAVAEVKKYPSTNSLFKA